MAIRLLIDGDACPVKQEIYKVALRHKVQASVVSNSWFRVPESPLIEIVVVSDGFDAADDWIAERADARSIVVTADILLAERTLKAGATTLSPKGKPFTENSIGGAIATRAIMADYALPQLARILAARPPSAKKIVRAFCLRWTRRSTG